MGAQAAVDVTFRMSFMSSQPWGDNCTVAQIRKQALDDADRAMAKISEFALSKGLRIQNLRAVECLAFDIGVDK